MDELLSQAAPLLPVVVGALIALMGGWIKHLVERREQKKQLRRDKLERLLGLVYGLKRWTDSLDAALAFGTTDKEMDSPVEEIEVLGNMYFHDFHAEIDAVVRAAKNYRGTMLALSADRLRNKKIPDNANDKINELFKPLLKASAQLTDKARIEARRLS